MTPSAEALSWTHFVERSGEEGRRWLAGYRRARPVAALASESLALLRARRADEGLAVLERMRPGVDAAEDADPGVRAVLERLYHGALGYYFYTRSAWDAADAAMARAHDALADALGHRPFLLPLVVDCHEFRLHRARIARGRERWGEMWGHVEAARQMLEGCAPFCVLPDGSAAGMDELRGFYDRLHPLGGDEAAALAPLLDDGVRLRLFRRSVRLLCRLPWVAVPYP